MEFNVSIKDEYDIIKDGLIIAEANDEIIFRFDDLTIIFRILEIKKDSDNRELSPTIEGPTNKVLKYPIYIIWDNIRTSFSKRIEIATYDENSQKKELSVSYAVTGLKGKDMRSYIFRYTWYSKNI